MTNAFRPDKNYILTKQHLYCTSQIIIAFNYISFCIKNNFIKIKIKQQNVHYKHLKLSSHICYFLCVHLLIFTNETFHIRVCSICSTPIEVVESFDNISK